MPETHPVIPPAADEPSAETASDETALPKALASPPLTPEPEGFETEGEAPAHAAFDEAQDTSPFSENELSTEGVPEMLAEEIDWERALLDDEYLREIDNRLGYAGVIEFIQTSKSGDPADVAFVVNMLKKSAEGTATIDELLDMTAVWLRIQPDTEDAFGDEARKTLLNLHTHLLAIKEQHLRGEVLETRIYIGAPE